MNTMQDFIYDDEPKVYNEGNAYIAHIDAVSSKKELFAELSKKLYFPEYFGFTWDGLLDMLCDLSWLNEKKIILSHDDLPTLCDSDMKAYLEILLEALKLWRTVEAENRLKILFPKKAKGLIDYYKQAEPFS